MKNKTIVEFNKRLFKAFQARDIKVGAIPDLEQRLISDHMIETGQVDASQVNSVLEEITGIQSLDPTVVSFDPKFLDHITKLLPKNVVQEEVVFPVKHEREYIHLVMARPLEDRCYRLIESVTGSRIKPYCCNGLSILECIDTYYKDRPDYKEPVDDDIETLHDAALKSLNNLKTNRAEPIDMINDAALIRLVQHIMNTLVQKGISDFHIEPQESNLRIRFRKDGVMNTAWTWSPVFKDGIIPRLKMIANMDLDESHMPQDGAINFGLIKNRIVDVRVSSLPSLYGEKIVMRVLERDKKQLTLENLGMETRDAQIFGKVIHQPTGLILVTGPTGSGKSTTLYAVLNELNTESVNIVTAEDPVEYKLNGLTQVTCTTETGLTFNEALRSFLRQDPDIIMVGEIRDAETADISLKAAMTGHLVLSTLHTNDAAGAINRLTNMGIPPYLVASAQITVIAQRLMRRLCENCKEGIDPDTEHLRVLELNPEGYSFYRAVGCTDCSGTGYDGRMGIYEVLSVTDRIVDLILNDQPARVLKEAAVDEGMLTLRDAAILKLGAGTTTIEEVLRVTMDN